jgi:two-component system response regulator AlgR
MKILIADDEPLARQRLQHIVNEINNDYVVSEAANGLEVIERVNQFDPDVVLMDIRMPGMDGLEAAQHLASLESPPAVIFTTAYDEYALQAFSANAIDYLLKPLRKQQLKASLHSCRKLNKMQLEQLFLTNQKQPLRTHISTQVGGNIFLIPVSDIVAFYAEHKYVSIKYYKQQVLTETVIEDTLKSLQREFSRLFIRIHRNALVKRDQIEALQKQHDGRVLLKLKGIDAGFEVSRRHLAQVRKAIK